MAARAAVKKELVKGLFGPANGGVFSASLQVPEEEGRKPLWRVNRRTKKVANRPNASISDYLQSHSFLQSHFPFSLIGVFSPVPFSASSYSFLRVILQATIYDAGSLCLAAVPELTRIAISTPNLHYLPTTQLLNAMGVAPKDTT